MNPLLNDVATDRAKYPFKPRRGPYWALLGLVALAAPAASQDLTTRGFRVFPESLVEHRACNYRLTPDSGVQNAAGAFSVTAICAPRAIAVDDLTDRVFVAKNPDEQTLQGSIAKILTAGVALNAVKQGLVAFSDQVAISVRAQAQPCASLLDVNGDCVSDVQVGETFRLDGLMLGSMIFSAGEATDAIAEHVAGALHGVSALTPVGSEMLMNRFLGLMNERAATVPAPNSRFITVHGGDLCDFAIGCTPNCANPWLCASNNECAQGTPCPPSGTTARDLADIWRNIVDETPEFIDFAGRRSAVIQSTLGGQTRSYTLTQSFSYSPGLDGDKGGNSPVSLASLIAQATWFGRPIVGVVLNAAATPGVREAQMNSLFDTSFTELMRPERLAQSRPLLPVEVHALSCLSGSKAVSAFLDREDSRLDLVAWDVDLQGGTVRLSTTDVPEAFSPHLAPNISPGPAINGDVGVAPPTNLAMAHMGGGVLAVAVERGAGIDLMTWGVPPVGKPFVINGGIAAGQGRDVRLARLTSRILVSGWRNDRDRLVLRTWLIDDAGETIEPLDVAAAQPIAQEFDIAADTLGFNGRVLSVARNANGDREARSWLVDLGEGGGDLGSISHEATNTGGAASVVRAVSVEVPGQDPFSSAFVTAHRLNGGILRLILWNIDSAGGLVSLGPSDNLGPEVPPGTPVALVPTREAGVLMAIGEGQRVTLLAWGLDPDNPANGFTAPFPVVDTRFAGAPLLGACAIPTGTAEADVLVASGATGMLDRPLTLSAWRSGPR